MHSSTPTISAHVEIQVLRFCLVELTTGGPLPMYSPPPLYPLILGWTVNDAYIQHFRITATPVPRMSGIFLVLLSYFIIWANFFQLSVSGSLTLVVRNSSNVQVSGLALFVVYSVLSTRLWIPLSFYVLRLSHYLSTLNRFSGAALDLLLLLWGSIFSNSVCISPIYSIILILSIPLNFYSKFIPRSLLIFPRLSDIDPDPS